MNRYATIGLGVLAGAVLLEAGLIPGIVIGGGALLAARFLPQAGRGSLPDAERVVQPQRRPGAALPVRQNDARSISLPAGLRIKQVFAKTITFRIIVTAFGFVLGPFVYLGHEMLWDYYSIPQHRRPGAAVANAALPIGR
jgi:hypothetical protein